MARKGLGLITVLFMLLPIVAAAAEITIYDNQSGLDNPYWRNQDEDQEVEPWALTSPDWDLEGMFYSNDELSIGGERDFLDTINGVRPGDIFISANRNASDLEGFIAHFTQECGDDVITGQVPEPATMLLLGAGLLGASAVCRKKYPKRNIQPRQGVLFVKK